MGNVAIAFFHSARPGSDPRIPTLMVQTVYKTMPDAVIYQLSDSNTSEIAGVNYVISDALNTEHLMLSRLKIYSAYADHYQQQDTIFVDTDVIFQRDLNFVFTESDFDIAVTRRHKVVTPQGHNVAKVMPFNNGVIFARSSAGAKKFWQEVYLSCSMMPDNLKHWYGDQLAVAEVVAYAPLIDIKVKELPCDPYNFTPDTPDINSEDWQQKHILHFKGKRKDWMLAYAEKWFSTQPEHEDDPDNSPDDFMPPKAS
jgi:hypothetical protein